MYKHVCVTYNTHAHQMKKKVSHTYTFIHTYLCICINVCACVRVCVTHKYTLAHTRERECHTHTHLSPHTFMHLYKCMRLCPYECNTYLCIPINVCACVRMCVTHDTHMHIVMKEEMLHTCTFIHTYLYNHINV